MINWLCTEGEDQLRRHVTVANNLRAIEAQRLEFTKFQSVAEVCICVIVYELAVRISSILDDMRIFSVR